MIYVKPKKEYNKRTKLAFKYIRGRGVEMGALHQPLEVPPNVEVIYVDTLNYDELLTHYPEVPKEEIVCPDIIDDAETLSNIKDETFDFCVANHVMEHMRDPVGALINWMRILKPGGILYLAVPDINNPLDDGRELTTLEHLIQDYHRKNDEEDYKHFAECAKYWHDLSDEDEIERIAHINRKKGYSIHYHTFNKKLLEQIFSYIFSLKKGVFRIVDAIENEINGVKEYIYIIEKTNFLNKIIELLAKSSFDKQEVITQKQVDVIIPVYNAYADFIKCFYSVLKYQEGYRIILIDDKSTDQCISELFSTCKSFKRNDLILLENEENKGFVKTVNHGMKYSKNDIVILNSDTIVSADWVNKLKNCAYSDDTIATATPFTNNGTISSIPNFCEDNQIPEGFTIGAFADFIERLSFKQYPKIPTAIGFCMYIRRDVINKIGYFDEETFGKGYGEENDFCIRAIREGYKNVLCDDTFIFHKGEASFLDGKTNLIKKNLDIISKMYPDYLPTVALFCQLNPLKQSHENIKLRMPTWDITGKKKRILYVLHHLGGGTEQHVMDLIKSLTKCYIFYTLQVIGKEIYLLEYNNNKKLKYLFHLSNSISTFSFHNEEYKGIIQKILNTFKIDLIHVQHLIGHTLDIFHVAEEQNIPILLTIHDYYVVCPRINLLDENLQYCQGKNNLNKCSVCLSKSLRLPLNIIEQWRRNFEDAFNKCDMVIAPNSSVFEILRKYYNLPMEKTIVIDHGHKKELFDLTNTVQRDKGNSTFHIAYIGVLAPHKGSKIFYKLTQTEELKKKVKWSIIGTSYLHPKPGYYPKYNIHVTGKYKSQEELFKIIRDKNIHLAIFPSIGPETYSFTLSEAWMAGIPPIVSNLGALKERVEKTKSGWIVSPDAKSFKNKIIDILSNPEEYYLIKSRVKEIKLKSFEEAVEDYLKVYDTLIDSSERIESDFNRFTNAELYRSLTNSVFIAKSSLTEFLTKNINRNLWSMLIQCYNDNGLKYTLKIIITYVYIQLIRKEKL